MLRVALLLSVLALGCAAPAGDEGASATTDALRGTVTVGRIVETATDGLRLRSSTSRDTLKNIIGTMPKGTQVKIIAADPADGFYQVKVLDAALTKKWKRDTGWVFGEYLTGESEDPDTSHTGEWDEPSRAVAKLVVKKCEGMTDDRGNAFAPTLDDALSGKSAYAAIGIDTNTFAYGMKATIDEVTALSSSGKTIEFKVLKTAASAPAGPFTATICTKSGAAPAGLSAEEVSLAVYAYW